MVGLSHIFLVTLNTLFGLCKWLVLLVPYLPLDYFLATLANVADHNVVDELGSVARIMQSVLERRSVFVFLWPAARVIASLGTHVGKSTDYKLIVYAGSRINYMVHNTGETVWP